jgi:aryl-alcohol dehydrogenase-like predicted oxidoreductase
MINRKFGWTNVDIPVIGQGTWLIEKGIDTLAFKTLQKGLDRGMTHIDTVEMYGDGKAEKLVGWIFSVWSW